MANQGWLARFGPTLYGIANVAMLLAAFVGIGVHGAPVGVAVYAYVLVAICSAPLLLAKRTNDRYALLGAFMLLYFLFFGALDVQHLILGSDTPFPQRVDFLDSAELAILMGAAAMLCGYLVGAQLWQPQGREAAPSEWPTSTLLPLGLVLWALGTAAMFYLSVFVFTTKDIQTTTRGFAAMGPVLTFVVMLGHLIQPFGVLILAYGYAKNRNVLWLALILAVVSIQVAVGFISDIKSEALKAMVLVIMVRTLVDNRLPKAWLVGLVTFIIITFPIFQAYRQVVAGERGLNRAQAFSRIGDVLDWAVAARDQAAEGSAGRERAQTFLERSSSKDSLQMLLDHVGKDVEFLHGASLVAIPMAFVPRLLVPDKADLPVSLLFNRKVLKSDTDTNISISHIGEWYWNFGWAGVGGGMLLFGMLLGFVGAKFSLDQGVSLTHVLVLLATVQSMCMGFGGNIPISYVIWLRSMAAIGLMHLVFARRTVATSAPAVVDRAGTSPALSLASPRFPNMLR